MKLSQIQQSDYVFAYADARSNSLFKEVTRALKDQSFTSLLLFGGDASQHEFGFNFYQDFNYQELKNEVTREKVDNYFFKNIKKDPTFFYKSDPRCLNLNMKKEYLLYRTYFTLSTLKKALENAKPKILFTIGGGSLISNACFFLCEKLNIKVYRFSTLEYLNTYHPSKRFVFYDHNFYHLSKNKINKESNEWEYAKRKASDYYDSIQKKYFSPDQFSKKFALESAFTANNSIQALKHLSIFLIKLTLNPFKKKPFTTIVNSGQFLRYVNKKLNLLLIPFQKVKIKKNKDPYFLFPMHLPYDSQISFRAKQYFDQVSLIRLIADNLPYGTKLYIKEHPIIPGMIPFLDLYLMLKKYKNIHFLGHKENFRSYLEKSIGVITINSTAGLESVINNKPSLVLGDSFYSHTKPFYQTFNLKEVPDILYEMKNEPKLSTKDDVTDVIASIIYQSYPKSENEESLSPIELAKFSLIDFIKKSRT